MTYNNARRLRDYSPPLSLGVEEASKMIRKFMCENQDSIIKENWRPMFDGRTMIEVAEYIQSEPCPCCLGDNIRSHVLVDHVTCGDCGHSY